MRKYFVIIILLPLFYLPSASQDARQKKVQHEIDSLKYVLPGLRDSARVDCLNTLAYVFDDLPYNYFITADSVYPYASQAYTEANKIGYTRGLGYANLRMAYYYYMIADNYSVLHNKYNPDHFDSIDKHIKQAISIGEKLNDKIMVGVGYDLKANLEDIQDNDKQMVTYLNQAVSHVEKWNKQSGTYKEPGYVDCPGCKGNESWLGNLYMELYRNYLHNKEYADAEAQLQKAIQLFEKIGDPYELGKGYSSLSQLQVRQRNFSAVENSAKKSLLFFQEAGDWQGELNVLNQLSKFYWDRGNFENGLEYGERSVFLSDKYFRSKPGTSPSDFEWDLFWMGSFYQYAGDYETAMEYMRRLKPYSRQSPLAYELRMLGIGETYRLMGNLDSAMRYLTYFESDTLKVGSGKVSLGYLYLDLKQYDKAIRLIKEGIEIEKKKDNIGPVARGLQVAGKAYFLKKDYNTALQYARKASAAMKSIKMNTYLTDNYKLLSEIFHEIKRNDSAYYYSRAYTNLKDSLINRQFLWKLNNIKKQAEEERKTSQINLLKKENQLKEQKLKQQATLRNSLIIGILLLLLLGVFIFRNLLLKRKNDKLQMQNEFELVRLEDEKKQAELHQRAVELEMQALRAQMNPHFIFNCLSSINRFIFKNDNKAASDYLTRFSRLIRMVLMNSSRKLITLEDELEMLRLYLDLERLRFKDAFDYSITTTNIVDAGGIFIPPLLLQPFCENAVWHGLMHKETKGHLNIIISEVISEHEKVLHCIIEDDGVGREKAAEMKSKSAENEKSLGLKITTERLALLNQENNFSTFYKIEDILNENNEVAGTRVQLKIRHKESIEELL